MDNDKLRKAFQKEMDLLLEQMNRIHPKNKPSAKTIAAAGKVTKAANKRIKKHLRRLRVAR